MGEEKEFSIKDYKTKLDNLKVLKAKKATIKRDKEAFERAFKNDFKNGFYSTKNSFDFKKAKEKYNKDSKELFKEDFENEMIIKVITEAKNEYYESLVLAKEDEKTFLNFSTTDWLKFEQNEIKPNKKPIKFKLFA